MKYLPSVGRVNGLSLHFGKVSVHGDISSLNLQLWNSMSSIAMSPL